MDKIFNRSLWRSAAQRFRRDDRGAVAIVFALTLIPVLGIAGVAIDYSRAELARNHLQDAADAAALAAGVDLASQTPDIQKAAKASFDADIKGLNNVTITNFKAKMLTVQQDGSNGVRVDATGHMKTELLGLIGVNSMDVSVFSEIGVANKKVEVSLVLDNTGSMGFNNKLNTLKIAATNLVNAMKPNSQADNVKFSLVPFSRYVNIGMANRHEPGVFVEDDYIVTPGHQSCTDTYPNSTLQTTCSNPGTKSCTTVSVAQTCYSDGVPYSCTGSKTTCTGSDPSGCTTSGSLGDAVQKCTWVPDVWARWYGCVGSRSGGLDEVDSDYTTQVPGLLATYNNCEPAALTRLTDSKSTVLSAINGMYAKGETYIPAGLMWGWRSLSSITPFGDGAPTDPDVVKAIVLMTDGINTVSPTYPQHTGSDTAVANNKTAKICENIKKEGIMVFTIAFDVADPGIKTVLQNCVGNGGEYFDATDNNKLKSAFREIALTLMNLRLTR
ncbi:MAG: pilus assembly protein [Hyphomicrobiales bacterium]